MLVRPALLVVVFLACALTVPAGVHDARAQSVPDGFSVSVVHANPAAGAVGFAFLPDERILVISRTTGQVRLVVDGALRADPVGTVQGVRTDDGAGGSTNERGLLGIAVDPDWPAQPYLYMYYTHVSGFNRVVKVRTSGDLDDPASMSLTFDASSQEILLQMQDDAPFHNAGTLRFGSDKTLYVSHGDDTNHASSDPQYLQDLTNRYGKILRINRDGTAAAGNPTFPEEPDGRLPEIFAIGLRNPFRFAIDPLTDRLFIGDVGTQIREEFNLAEGGENFGYPKYEGSTFFREYEPLIQPEPTPPVVDYAYNPSTRSAIALSTYRPADYPHDASFPPAFDGVHFHTDFFSDEIRYLKPDGLGGWQTQVFGSGFSRLTDAAIAPDGSLYVITYDGGLRRIAYAPSVGVDDAETPTAAFELRPNHPNPFGRETSVTFRVGRPEHVRLDVYDLLGRHVTTLVDAWQSEGVHTVRFDASGLASGTYVCRLQAGGTVAVRTMVRLGR